MERQIALDKLCKQVKVWLNYNQEMLNADQSLKEAVEDFIEILEMSSKLSIN